MLLVVVVVVVVSFSAVTGRTCVHKKPKIPIGSLLEQVEAEKLITICW